MAEELERAAAAGLPVVTDPDQLSVDPTAARLLPSTHAALAHSMSAGVLGVLVDHVPSPAEFRDIERTAGMLVTVTVTTKELIDRLRDQLRSAPGAEAWGIAPVLRAAVERGASDVHLAAGTVPVLRIHGELIPMDMPALSAEDLTTAASWITGTQLDASFSGDHDCAVSFAGHRWRASVWRQRGALAVTLRLIPSQVPRLDELGLPTQVVDLANLTNGLILFCGPTGSGKSTSMAALVDRINRTRADHILTIENPVEYIHADHLSLVRQREVGADTQSFATGLRSALRQDPDVILVGELRDLETMQTALSAAETGHLVLATVHASSTAQVVNRIVNSFPAEQQDQVRQQLAASLQAVVAQVLLPAHDGGRRALAVEVLIANAAVRNMIRDNRLHEIPTALDTSGGTMVSMDRSLSQLVLAGKVAVQEAERHVGDLKVFTELLRSNPALQRSHTPLDPLDPLDGAPRYGS